MKTARIKIQYDYGGPRNYYKAWVTHRRKVFATFTAYGKHAVNNQAQAWAMNNGFTRTNSFIHTFTGE